MMQSGGGGGFGDPMERDPELVAEDVREGYVSPTVAHNVYGVVLTTSGDVDTISRGKISYLSFVLRKKDSIGFPGWRRSWSGSRLTSSWRSTRPAAWRRRRQHARFRSSFTETV